MVRPGSLPLGMGLALALAALMFCPGASVALAAEAKQSEEIANYKRAVDKQFSDWLEALRPEAEAAGVTRATFDANLKGLTVNWSLPQLVYPNPAAPGGPALPEALAQANKPKHQPEFDSPAGYFNDAALNALAATGRIKLTELRQTMGTIQKKYGVPADIIVAIWGRETGFGKVDAPYDAISTLATQAFMGRNQDKSREELIAALKILQDGHATRAEMKSSWAGAMGYTQFMPSDFDKYAVDFDGDGRRDIWRSLPDALASTGNSLHSQGWDESTTWAYEVILPKGLDCSLQGPDKARPLAEWVKLGVARVKNRAFPPEKLKEPMFLVLPAGTKGPAFLATNNFSVLKLYNNSDLYAIFVGHVADMISGSEPAGFVAEWQPVDRFPRELILHLQQALVAKGYDVGRVDGLSGFKTRRSVGVEERKHRLPVTCYPSTSLINAELKEGSSPRR